MGFGVIIYIATIPEIQLIHMHVSHQALLDPHFSQL